MKIWGSTTKQRMSIWVSFVIIWLWSIAWVNADNYHKTGDMFSTFLCLGTTLAYILFAIYLFIDNGRATDIRIAIRNTKHLMDDVVEKNQFEFNNRTTRLRIAGIIETALRQSNKTDYNFTVKDITTAIEQDNQMAKYEISADNQVRSIYLIITKGTWIS